MMMSSDTEDSVSITEHLRDLQEEKKKLENKLEHLRVRRRDLETKYETVSKKNLNLNQKNDSMRRTVNVAKMKVQETQMLVDKYQENSDQLQKTVNELKEKIESEEKKKENMLTSYIEKYDAIGDRFRNAKLYYTEEKLLEENQRWKSSCEKKIFQAREHEELMKKISDRLSHMKLCKEKEIPEEKPAKSLWQQFNEHKNVAMDVLRQDEKVIEDLAVIISERNKKANNSLNEVEDGLSRLKQDIAGC